MSKPVKILYVIDQFKNPLAGTEGQLYQLVKNLDRSRFEPHFLIFQTSDYIERHGFVCQHTVLGHNRLSSFRTWYRLWQIARRFRRDGYELAHIFFNDPSIICPPVFRAAGIKSLISRRDMGYWYTPMLKNTLRVTRHFLEGALVNSTAVKNITFQAEKIPEERIHVIYNGYVAPSPNHTSAVQELVELKAQGLVLVGLVANVRPIKRIEDLILAVGKVKDSCPALHAVVIGGGDITELDATAKKLGIGDRVHFMGAREDVVACLEYLDFGVLCSESEGFSNSIVEYMEAGLPVVCTDTGGNPEAITHGETGLLYDVGDIDSLAENMEQLVANPRALAEMGLKSRESARRRFSVQEMVAAHEKIYLATAGVDSF